MTATRASSPTRPGRAAFPSRPDTEGRENWRWAGGRRRDRLFYDGSRPPSGRRPRRGSGGRRRPPIPSARTGTRARRARGRGLARRRAPTEGASGTATRSGAERAAARDRNLHRAAARPGCRFGERLVDLNEPRRDSLPRVPLRFLPRRRPPTAAGAPRPRAARPTACERRRSPGGTRIPSPRGRRRPRSPRYWTRRPASHRKRRA